MPSRVEQTINWLLEGDPSIRCQVFRDLLRSPQSTVKREQQEIAREGWGARLLAAQDSEGTWGDGFYNPKWTSTHYTMLLLRDLGLPPRNLQARKACELLLDNGLTADGGVNYSKTERGETCISGMSLSLFSYFKYKDERVDTLARHLLAQQMSDGGWNCRRFRGATHASVNTTISVLEGLRLYEDCFRKKSLEVSRAQQRGREFLLAHRLFRSHRTGKVIRPEFTQFAFPPRWHYDVLRALDYFQSVNAPRDQRLSEAIEMVRKKRQPDGGWLLERYHSGKSFFQLERIGAPSRWNTLRAMRVLKWWDGKRT